MPLNIQDLIYKGPPRTIYVKSYNSKEAKQKLEFYENEKKNFFKIIKKADIKKIKIELEKSFAYFRADKDYCLEFCSANGFYHLVKVLLQDGYEKHKLLHEEKGYEYPKYSDIFEKSLCRAFRNGHLNVMKLLLEYSKEDGKKQLEKLTSKSFNLDVDYRQLITSNMDSIQNNINKINAINSYNNNHKTGKNYKYKEANVSTFDQMLINTFEETQIGEDYNSDYKSDDNQDDEIQEDDIQEDDIQEDYQEIDDYNSEDKSDEEEPVKQKKVVTKKSKTYNRLYDKKTHYKNGSKSESSRSLKTIIWCLENEIFINTNYSFISNYLVTHKMYHIIKILKNNNRFVSDLSFDFSLLNLKEEKTYQDLFSYEPPKDQDQKMVYDSDEDSLFGCESDEDLF